MSLPRTEQELPERQDPPRSPRRGRTIAVVAALALAALVAAGIWWFLRDDAPDEVDLDDAVAALDESTDDDAAEGSDPADGEAEADDATGSVEGAASSAGIDGEWVVDTSVGEFNYEDTTSTFVGFRIQEELTGIGSATAVGRTPEVSGTIAIEGSTVTDALIEADMTAITTNDSRRDSAVARAIGASEFPTATFELTEPIDLGEDPGSGNPVSATAVGDLTVHGQTNPVEIPIDGQLIDDTIVIVGSVEIEFADYGVEVPSAPIVVSAEDNGIVELQLFMIKA